MRRKPPSSAALTLPGVVGRADDAREAATARAENRVGAVLYRTALAGDRRAVLITILATVSASALMQRQGGSRTVWLWCALNLLLAVARVAVNLPRNLRRTGADTPTRPAIWLAVLFLSCASFGLGAPLFLRSDPSIESLITVIFLAAAGLSAPLVSASRTAVYLSLLPALVPLLLTLAISPLAGASSAPANSWLLGAIVAAFLVVLERLTMAQNDSLALLLTVRFRNEDLVAQLRTQVEVAARAVEEKTRFVASAAHDLRQPLHALGMFCATLEQRLQGTPEKPLVRNMMNAIESLEESFGAMLDISRLDAALVQSAPQNFPIRDLFRRLYQQFGGDAEARNLALRFRATRRIVRSDPLLLERVLANLVQNALRYTRSGGVLVAARRHPRGIALEVWDTGAGIPDDKREMIFREFYQLDNPERDRGRGLGMGLAIVQRLCRLLEHPLEVQSKPGRGSVFRVIVPRGDRSALDAKQAETVTLPPRRTGLIRILLIDDDRAIREATRQLLEPMQVDVVTAATIDEAVARATDSSERIDMVLSDWRLRGQENGILAVRAVRSVTGEATPAVLITGDTDPQLLKLAHESGLVVLHKPLQPRQLIRLIKHLRR
jgi:signal transduction histidine kinase